MSEEVRGSRTVSHDSRVSTAPADRATRVLVVEPRGSVTRMLRRWAEGRGHALDVAHDVQGASERAPHMRPSAVIIDLDSTPSGGVELAERLSNDPATRAIPLIAIGAATSPLSERMRRRFARHLIKPIDVEELGATILETVT